MLCLIWFHFFISFLLEFIFWAVKTACRIKSYDLRMDVLCVWQRALLSSSCCSALTLTAGTYITLSLLLSLPLSRPCFSPSVTSIDQHGCFTVHRLQPPSPLNKNRLPKCDSHQHLLPVLHVRRSLAAFLNQCECQRPWGGFLPNSCPTLTSDLPYGLKCPFESLLHWPLRLVLSFKLSLYFLNIVSTFFLSPKQHRKPWYNI